jgi:ABC-type sugar transport system substrate-binding protein
MVRRITVAVISVALVAALYAVFIGGSATAADKPGLAVFYYNTSPYGIAEKNAGVNAGNKAGFNVTTFTPNNDPKLEATQVQDAITSGKYKAFWMATLDPVSMAPVAKQAEAKGILLGQADYTFGGQAAQLKLKATPGITTTVGYDQVSSETMLLAMTKDACAQAVGRGKPCKFAFMPGLTNFPTDVLKINYLKKQFAKGPIKMTVMPQGGYDQPTAQKAALTYFGAHKNDNVIGTLGDQMTAGVLTAMKQSGLKPGKKVKIWSVGGTKEMIAQMKKGLVTEIGGLWPRGEAEVGIPLLAKALQGKKVPAAVNIISKQRPLIITQAFLKANPKFVPDWNLG